MKDTQVKPPTSKLKSKTCSTKGKMPAKKLKDQKVKSPKAPKTKKPSVKVNKKPKTEKVETNVTPKRKRGRPRLEDKTQNKKKIKEQQKPPKSADNKSVSRKRKISQTIKGEKETSHTPSKKLKTNDTNCTMNGNIKGVLPNFNKLCNQKGETQSSSAEHTITNHVNTNGTLHCKKNSKQPVNNFILKSATFIPPPPPPLPKKEMINGKGCLKTSKTVLAKEAKAIPKSEPESSLPTNTVKEIKTTKPNNFIIPFKEPMKLHPQRMASLDAMAKLHVICIPDRKPIEHHSRTTTSVVTVCSQPSTHQKSVTQVHERIHFDVKKEGKDCKGNIVHKQINYVKEKQEVFVSHSVEQSAVVEEPKASNIKSEKDPEKKKKPKSTSQSTTNNTAQKKSAKLNQSTLKASLVPSTKIDKSKTTKKGDLVKKSAKSPKVLKDLKKPSKEKQISKGNNHKTKKLEQTKSEVKVKETIRMQKTCTYQSVTTVNSHGTTNSSVVPVSHVGLTTNYSKTKKTVVTDEECKNNLNYSSGSVINKSYCVTSESPCSLGHQTDCCKFHTHTSPQIIPFAHVQTCTFGHGLNRTTDASSSSSPHCDGNYALHRFGHQPLIYTSPSQECGCCCSSPLVQNVRDSCILRKSIMTYPHHFSHHTHLPAGAFPHDSLCTDYHPGSSSVDATKHAQHFSLSPSSSSHSRISCCSYCELHPGGNQCHHQPSGNCLQFMSAPKNSSSIVSCEQSPLDLSLASTSSGSSLEVDHPLQQGHCPSPLCCTGEVLLLRTSTPHNFQHTTFSPKNPCCRCNKQIGCENPNAESVQQVPCSSKSFENQSHQLVENIALSSPAAPKELLLPPVSPASKVVSKDTPQVDNNFVQAKLEKNISPKQSSKTLVSKKRQFSHGWSWKGKPKEKLIAFTNDSASYLRICYPSVQHKEGDVINERDCVLLKSGPKDTDLPYVAKVTSLWENPEDGEMMMSLLWYYRPEHTDQGRKLGQMEDEVFASRHKDVNSIACIEDKCYVLTYNEYCRYRASLTMEEDAISVTSLLVPELPDHYSRKNRLPVEAVSSDIVFFCRHVYDFRQKRILKNPT